MEFVVDVLEDVFQKSPAEAYRIMMQVHLNGRGIAGVYPWEVAETKVDTLADAARARPGIPLQADHREKRELTVFSAALEVVLHHRVTARPSRAGTPTSRSSICSTRSRTTPTASGFSPPAAPICRGCGATSTPISTNRSSSMTRGDEREPEQTAAFRRVLQTAILHVQSAQRGEAHAGDILAAILQQPKTHAAQLLAEQGVTRLDILDYISHGISKVPRGRRAGAGSHGARRRRRRRRIGDRARPAGRLLRRTSPNARGRASSIR